jgi:hypothetical protein
MNVSDNGNPAPGAVQGKITNIKKHINRPLFRRLRESYLADMVTILQAANDGKCSSVEAFEIASDLQAKVKILREGGPLEKLLNKADMVILDKVFNDVNRSETDKDNVVDLTSEDNGFEQN